MRLSISRIKLFKACRRAFELRYKEGLVPVQKSDALETGTRYHELLEKLYSGEELPDEFTKERAMVEAYKKYIYPDFEVTKCEEWIEKDLPNGSKLVGIADGMSDNYIVEHKTTGSEITEEYEYNLLWDEQILAYMYLTGLRKIYYTVCRKPTIRQKKNESDEEFYQRMVEWYDTDTDSKIKLLEIFRTDDEVEQFEKDLLAISEEIDCCKNYYKNTNHCNKWGRRCEYSSVCQFYNPNQEYIEFEKREVVQ